MLQRQYVICKTYAVECKRIGALGRPRNRHEAAAASHIAPSWSQSYLWDSVVPGTVSEGLNVWSEALTAGLAVKTAKPLS